MKNTGRLLCLAFVAFIFSLSVAIGGSAQAATRMPDFALNSVLDGKAVSSSNFEGKVLLVTFFATWCPPCIEEIPTLKELHSQLGAEGFSVVALSVDQSGPADVAKMVKKKAINYPVLMADEEVMKNFGGVYGIPVSFLVNKKGNVVKKYTGYVSGKTLLKDIKSILK
ncbi:TlpA disulfide reductase family protein [Desulfopila sp. IMCC35008]|uniref:TlpA disulfide reductase family protein n=1 Tax=Desulfopila sp. IMCC35008 TaxID=2653858 RepID=UPI0013D356EA|nr:TlpA disulfide reductase family protein [Desulfopila sp. IMCC35008]